MASQSCPIMSVRHKRVAGQEQGGHYSPTVSTLAPDVSAKHNHAPGTRKLDAINDAVKQYLSREQLDPYVATLSPLTPTNFIGHSSPSSIFVQFGTYDSWTPKIAADRLFEAAGKPKQVRWHLTSHEFTDL